MADESKDLQDFLAKVDEVGSLVKDLTKQEADTNEVIKKADDYISKVAKKTKRKPVDNTGVNRTVINHAAFKDNPHDAPNTDNMEQEAFMRVMEVDAKERRERRLKQRQEATVHKEAGNVHFAEGRYEEAVELYSKALTIVKDLTAVWTNRAQAYIKLGKYEEALSDCDWALRVDEKCLKAYVHRGRAYLEQKKYDEAITAFNDALNVDPTKQLTIQDYIDAVHRQRTADEQEASARSFLEAGTEGATTLVQLLRLLQNEAQHHRYYAGALRLMAQRLTDDTSRTLFQTEGGLKLTNSHTHIARCWRSKLNDITMEEADMLTSLLETYTSAVKENDENQQRLMCEEGFADGVLRCGETTSNKAASLRAAVVCLLYTISQHDFGLKLITQSTELERLLGVIFSMATVKGQPAVHALCLLNNLSQYHKFLSQVRPIVEEHVLVPSESLMMTASCQPAVLVLCAESLSSLTSNSRLRLATGSRSSLWAACTALLNSNKVNKTTAGSLGEDLLVALLSLIIRLTPDLAEQPAMQAALCGSAEQLARCCVQLLTCGLAGVEMRAAGVLSHLIPPGGPAVEAACTAGVIPLLVGKLQGDDAVVRKTAMKVLAGCTRHQEESRQTLLRTPKALPALVDQLKEQDEAVVGNAALCLSHLTAEERVAVRLAKTNIVQHLLVKARDGLRPQLQHNCAILLATLAKSDQRHLERLRELHGVEILVDVMRHIKQ